MLYLIRKEIDMTIEKSDALISVPKEVMNYYKSNTDPSLEFRKNALLLYPMIQDLVISTGRAAEILGVRKWDLIEYYNSLGIPYLNQSKDDLLADLDTYHRLKERKNDSCV